MFYILTIYHCRKLHRQLEFHHRRMTYIKICNRFWQCKYSQCQGYSFQSIQSNFHCRIIHSGQQNHLHILSRNLKEHLRHQCRYNQQTFCRKDNLQYFHYHILKFLLKYHLHKPYSIKILSINYGCKHIQLKFCNQHTQARSILIITLFRSRFNSIATILCTNGRRTYFTYTNKS